MTEKIQTRKTIVILQPGYIPWLGFFDLIYRADTFVIFDDVQYTTRDWRNRNRIKTANGPFWYTIPVMSKGAQEKQIKDVRIDNTQEWQRKQLRGLDRFYKKALYFSEIRECINTMYSRGYTFLIDVDMDFIYGILQYLSLERQFVFSSELALSGIKDEKLLCICKALNATHYLSGDAAMHYLRESIFSDQGIAVEWQNYRHPYYNQLWLKEQGFISHLSILDLLFNHGPDSLDILTGRKNIVEPDRIRIRNANAM